MRFKPVPRIGESHGSAEFGVVGKMEQDKGGGIRVGRHSADRDGGPDAGGLLKLGQIVQTMPVGVSAAPASGQGAEAQGGGHQVTPSAVGFLSGKDGSEQDACD